VQNVETLANVALIARRGAGWYREVGTATDPGTMLVTVSGGVNRPGVYEVPLGTPLTSVLAAARAAAADSVEALLVGGYFGTWIPIDRVGDLTLSPDSLRAAGASLGCGVLFALPRGTCGLRESATVARWLADQSAGQCGPCIFGLDAIASAMAELVHGRRRRVEADLSRWLRLVQGRGACKHPDGAARFVESALRVFSSEIRRHEAGSCTGTGRPLLPVPPGGAWR
jgi:NADH:ubiquinone oxidoreductase subunit F (NADH-binding)